MMRANEDDDAGASGGGCADPDHDLWLDDLEQTKLDAGTLGCPFDSSSDSDSGSAALSSDVELPPDVEPSPVLLATPDYSPTEPAKSPRRLPSSPETPMHIDIDIDADDVVPPTTGGEIPDSGTMPGPSLGPGYEMREEVLAPFSGRSIRSPHSHDPPAPRAAGGRPGISHKIWHPSGNGYLTYYIRSKTFVCTCTRPC